ncbi:MAG: hypothetical protein KDB53_19375 [Planctomycetes bacterium]|nr:hypothetical protein [Planctomycetota bacterium]
MRVEHLALTVLIAAALIGPVFAQKKDGQWADDISYTTDWDGAIKAVQESGKMLFIYNGWKNEGI